MGNKVIVKLDTGENVEFEDVVGHQVGNGAVQILERSGNQRIFKNFNEVEIILAEETAAKFAFDLAEMEGGSQSGDYEEIVVSAEELEELVEEASDNVVELKKH